MKVIKVPLSHKVLRKKKSIKSIANYISILQYLGIFFSFIYNLHIINKILLFLGVFILFFTVTLSPVPVVKEPAIPTVVVSDNPAVNPAVNAVIEAVKPGIKADKARQPLKMGQVKTKEPLIKPIVKKTPIKTPTKPIKRGPESWPWPFTTTPSRK